MKHNFITLKTFEENDNEITNEESNNEIIVEEENQVSNENLNETINTLSRYQIQLQEDIEKESNKEKEIEKEWNKEEESDLDEEENKIITDTIDDNNVEKVWINIKKVKETANTVKKEVKTSNEKLEIVEEKINNLPTSFWTFLWSGFSSIFNWLGPTWTVLIGTGLGCFVFYRWTAVSPAPITNINYPPISSYPHYPQIPQPTNPQPELRSPLLGVIAALIGFIFGRRGR